MTQLEMLSIRVYFLNILCLEKSEKNVLFYNDTLLFPGLFKTYEQFNDRCAPLA